MKFVYFHEISTKRTDFDLQFWKDISSILQAQGRYEDENEHLEFTVQHLSVDHTEEPKKLTKFKYSSKIAKTQDSAMQLTRKTQTLILKWVVSVGAKFLGQWTHALIHQIPEWLFVQAS